VNYDYLNDVAQILGTYGATEKQIAKHKRGRKNKNWLKLLEEVKRTRKERELAIRQSEAHQQKASHDFQTMNENR
jgi:hypothetical protein